MRPRCSARCAPTGLARTRPARTLEIDAEVRYEASLRRALGDEFDARYAEGLALDEAHMIALAFAQLAEIIEPADT